jgi:hypothetical protein
VTTVDSGGLVVGEKWSDLRYCIAISTGYLILSISLVFFWAIKGIHSLTGDEPSYLEIGRRLVDSSTFEQITTEHTVMTESGLYSIHGIGLPILIAVPNALGGETLVRLGLVALSALLIPILWSVSAPLFPSARSRAVSIGAIVSSASFVTFAGQIYPDLVVGVFLLAAIALLWRSPDSASSWLLIGAAVLMAALPWIHIKYALPAGLITLVLAYRFRYQGGRRVWIIILIFGISVLSYCSWNFFTYGSFSGAYLGEAVALSTNSLMVFFGLALDRNAGFLFTSPILWIGVLSLGIFWKRDRLVAALVILVALYLLVINASHGNLYGGGGFAGRFGVTTATLLTLPTLVGLSALLANFPKIWRVVTGVVLAINLFFWALIGPLQLFTGGSLTLFHKGPDVWVSSSVVFYRGLARFLPAFHNPDWFFQHLPNYAWLLVLLVAVVIGVSLRAINASGKSRKILFGTMAVLAGLVVAAGVFTQLPAESVSSRVDVILTPGVSEIGLVSQGPNAILQKGTFGLIYDHVATGPEDLPVGRWELVDAGTGEIISAGEISNTDGEQVQVIEQFEWGGWLPQATLVRFFWYGTHIWDLKSVGIASL